MNLICGSVRSNKKIGSQRFSGLYGQTRRDVNVSIFKQKLSFCYEKKENETKRSFFKMIVFIQLVIVSVTIVNNIPLLTIVNDYPLLTIINDDPPLLIVKKEKRREDTAHEGHRHFSLSSFKYKEVLTPPKLFKASKVIMYIGYPSSFARQHSGITMI